VTALQRGKEERETGDQSTWRGLPFGPAAEKWHLGIFGPERKKYSVQYKVGHEQIIVVTFQK
jgi:hypothetical protein